VSNQTSHTLALLFILAALVPHTQADVIFPGTHYVDRCAMISNAENFSETIFVANITGPMANQKDSPNYAIQNNKCLKKGYKFNRLNIYWLNKADVPTNGIDSAQLNENQLLSNAIEPYGGYVDDANAKTAENITYTIQKTGNTYTIQEIQNLDQNNDQQTIKQTTPVPTITPSKPTNQTNIRVQPENPPTQKNWIESILCFIQSLFGGTC
jgi:hypothetical protein